LMLAPRNSQSEIQAARIIRRGGVIAFRTDTFYGLGADPLNGSAVGRIRELKGREDAKPILVLVSDLTEVDRFITHQSEVFRTIADRLWPGPLTLVGVARPELPDGLTVGTGTIGVRLPNDERVCELVRACGGALTATSANPAGQPPARDADAVRNYFATGIDFVVDDGEVSATEASTVLDVSGEQPRLLREGAVTREQLANWVSL
jgi:L-threonylcarbamoyladenylate synthase